MMSTTKYATFRARMTKIYKTAQHRATMSYFVRNMYVPTTQPLTDFVRRVIRTRQRLNRIESHLNLAKIQNKWQTYN